MRGSELHSISSLSLSVFRPVVSTTSSMGSGGITVDIAMRLSRYFGTTPGFWMNLQMRYELERGLALALSECEREACRRSCGGSVRP